MVKLFVGNLPPSASNQSLREIFQQYNDLQDYKLISNYGFVYLETEESAIHAVNNLNGLEYRGFPIAVDFAKDQNQLKRKASLMLEKSLLSMPQKPIHHLINQHRNINHTNFSFLNSNRNLNMPFEKHQSMGLPPYLTEYNNEFESRNEYSNRILNDSSKNILPHNFQPISKRFRPDYSIENDFNNFADFRENMYHFSHPLKLRNWYDIHEKTSHHQYLTERDRKRHLQPIMRRPINKSYIDEYQDNLDYSSVDPYPAYLKQYRK